ncbi:hypothetical protein PR048_009198 [Dryococelus australis]|uniref:CCHC-type domain-containing protein n=1 Tax=Dryococelus australis TaxID=614101 RepID=A0ABQ9HZ83_9NEOP|nr:hypothetical protein PR048_009198 [Dryococelus australis]
MLRSTVELRALEMEIEGRPTFSLLIYSTPKPARGADVTVVCDRVENRRCVNCAARGHTSYECTKSRN